MYKPKNERKLQKHDPTLKLAVPFLLVMGVLSVVSFIIPLRPTVSTSEKRELTKFPEFSAEALISGSYFDDITLWFSDTFPGRETWITLSAYTDSLHGYSEIGIVEDDFVAEIMGTPENEEPLFSEANASEATVSETEVPETTIPDVTEETIPEETTWGGVDAGDDAEITMGSVVQIGDTAFNTLGFSEYVSKRYAAALSNLADALTESGVRVVSAPSPTSIGILVQSEYLEKLKCANQDEIIGFMHENMSENVVTVDTYSALVAHNSEYLYFRTDHHWTARGAYYSYAAICEALGMEAAPLESFEEWDQGEFLGSLYTKAPYKNKLKKDTVYAYIPQGDIRTYVLYDGYTDETELILDKTNDDIFNKYLAFLGYDYRLMQIVNDSIPDAGTCLVIKDSFGNCFAPFLTQNYHTVYVMDYRRYDQMSLQKFVSEYDVDDVIFIPYLIATQSVDGAKHFERLCAVH